MIKSEWWIEDRNTITLADGDIGQNHHECVVLIRACMELVDEINEKIPECELQEDYDGDSIWLKKDLLNQIDEDLESYLMSKGIEWVIINRALNLQQDHRLIGMRDYGWSAVRADRVDTWCLTQSKMKEIGWGLLEIADQENVYIDDDEFIIQDFSTKKIVRATPRQLIGGQVSLMTRQEAYVL